MKICSIVVLYEPNNKEIENILDYYDSVDKAYILDNSVESRKIIVNDVLSKRNGCVKEKAEYIHFHKNIGLWWKTDYFEVRYENPEDNQRFFYQLDGEGIRYEIVAFAKSVEVKKPMNYVEKGVSKSIAKIIESFNDRTDMIVI